MALSILDGNQTATTLSTVVTSGQHITAHTIVSLGTQAITEITGAVSGSVVTIPNLNVLARSVATDGIADATLNFVKIGGHQDGSNQTAHIVHVSTGGAMKVDASDSTVTFGTIRGTVTIGNSITIGSLPAISGTVTAGGRWYDGANYQPTPFLVTEDGALETVSVLVQSIPAGTNRIGVVTIGGGTVTIGAGTAQIGSVTASISGTVTANAGDNFANSIAAGILSFQDQDGFTINTLPALPAGTNQIGSVTASISSFATSVTARLINPAGTAVTYAEVGTAGSPSIDVLSVQGVTSGTAIAISGTVTANPSISSTAITSGSFTSLTSATLVPGNTARKMATVYNLGAGQLFVNAGASATTLGGGFMVALSSGDFYECNYTTTTLSAIFATAGTASWVSH